VPEVWDERYAGIEVLYGVWRGHRCGAGCRGSPGSTEAGGGAIAGSTCACGGSEVPEVRNERCAGIEVLYGVWRGDCGGGGSLGGASCDSAEAGRRAHAGSASGGDGWEVPEMRGGDTGWAEVLQFVRSSAGRGGGSTAGRGASASPGASANGSAGRGGGEVPEVWSGDPGGFEVL
jgi:hypothetical protein